MNTSTVEFPMSRSLPFEEQQPRVENSSAEKLVGHIVPVADLTRQQRERMYQLLAAYFSDVTRTQFDKDVDEKESIILLHDGAGRLQGFSTLMRLLATVDEQPIVAFFSGDTIIHRDCWGSPLLPRLWARHVFGAAATITMPVYWFLISSGYKTYRFLPTFFREFYPTFERPTPPCITRIVNALALTKFGRGYNQETGVVQFEQAARLRPEVAPITANRLHDPHVAFFAKANPGHLRGDELACITAIDPANLTNAGRRMLYGR